jgi:hypothetical protein
MQVIGLKTQKKGGLWDAAPGAIIFIKGVWRSGNAAPQIELFCIPIIQFR